MQAIMDGDEMITPELAQRLSAYFRTDAAFWLH
jgi:plasmid maintenance system antidote protein VapI